MTISILYNPAPLFIYEADGDRASGALAYFYKARTTTPLAVFVDAPMATPHTWPVVASAYGLLPPVYIPKGEEYKVRIEDALGNLLYAADSIDNPAAPTAPGDPDEGGGGGGGGLVITEDQIAMTGEYQWQPVNAARLGWVRSNGGTISSLAGSGSEYKNDDAHDLFVFIWNHFDNTECPVVPGPRGANADADWAMNKTIATLDMRGVGIAGLDQMGRSTPANRIQKTATITTTNGSLQADIPTGTGVCTGMYITAVGVPAGAYITAINGLTGHIVMNVAATATGAAVAAVFSVFEKADLAGRYGGENTHRMEWNELAQHAHGVTDPGHFHVVTTDADTSNLLIGREVVGTPAAEFDIPSSGGGGDSTNVNALAATKVTGVSIQNSGTFAPMNQWPPTRLGTWYVKL